MNTESEKSTESATPLWKYVTKLENVTVCVRVDINVFYI